jgi:hypothetical protein
MMCWCGQIGCEGDHPEDPAIAELRELPSMPETIAGESESPSIPEMIAENVSRSINAGRIELPPATWRKGNMVAQQSPPQVPEAGDFVDLIGQFTDFIRNERVRAYNEGYDAARAEFEGKA